MRSQLPQMHSSSKRSSKRPGRAARVMRTSSRQGLRATTSGTLRRLVDAEGFQIRTDFTTGQARWALVTDAAPDLRAA